MRAWRTGSGLNISLLAAMAASAPHEKQHRSRGGKINRSLIDARIPFHTSKQQDQPAIAFSMVNNNNNYNTTTLRVYRYYSQAPSIDSPQGVPLLSGTAASSVKWLEHVRAPPDGWIPGRKTTLAILSSNLLNKQSIHSSTNFFCSCICIKSTLIGLYTKYWSIRLV